MDLTTLMVTVFCMVDDWLRGKKLRQRGPQPTLHDSEVLTMEIIGELLGLDEDSAIYRYFHQSWSEWFPNIRRVHRVTFGRQASNLWKVKEQLWQHVLSQIEFDHAISLVDSFPVPVCRFARAYRCRRFREIASFGYDELAKQTYFGLRAHLRICWPGVIVGVELMPAHVHDLTAAYDLSEHTQGWLLADRNYWSPSFTEQAAQHSLQVVAPYRSSKRETQPLPLWITQTRRRIETVFSQLVGRFQAKTVWAHDLWHLSSRWLRKILSHTVAVLLCQLAGLESSLSFAQLLAQ